MKRDRPYDLVCFDVDGTLIEHPEHKVVWQILNRRFLGSDSVNKERYSLYSSGEISYSDWVAMDIGDWQRRGVTRDQVVAALGELRLVDGARTTLEELKARGYKLAVISGTLDISLETLFPDHPFDDVFCNKIRFGGDGPGEADPFAHTPRKSGRIAVRHGFVQSDPGQLVDRNCPRLFPLHAGPFDQAEGDILPNRH